jgi:hypothetical protein
MHLVHWTDQQVGDEADEQQTRHEVHADGVDIGA